ncbi:bifunctional phosphoribosyl-AMP cyclohydrolase/phosphoribosyl-ATP diphosphatase HisIE [Candidatus Micrarchaeota archaeon]|nr:bifunctional phosphoribosyl-AMP cyclohydrolase/phosphoribosyl-ATP diphosphatase HisIE [Candidatus Micrarchaeota archaeon]
MNEKLIPLIVQDADSKQVLSLFYCNEESMEKMRRTGLVWRYSRSRQMQMMKGATSGNAQKIVSLSLDCDRDALLAIVKQEGKGACHTGEWSCFGNVKGRSWGALDELCEVIASRKANPPKNSYVAGITGNPQAVAGKLEEEAEELAEAMLEKNDSEVVWEAADLLFFTLVALESRNVPIEAVLQELKRRRND